MHSLLTSSDTWMLAWSAPLAFLNAVWPYLVMLLGFSLIVFVHELGHFAVAKWAGVRVEKFAIGFGRELFGLTRGETRYSFNILPLGGFVKMLGQEDFDDKSEELKFKDDPRSFVNRPIGHRMAIVSAGVVMNVLFACFLFMIVFMIGMKSMGTRIAYISPDSPADRAGLQPGDDIRRINGEKVLGFNEVTMAIVLAPLHESIDFVVDRGGITKNISVKPEYMIPEGTSGGRRQIVGIRPGVTRDIIWVGPEIDQTKPDHPHVGDVIVQIDGIEVTDANASEMVNMLAHVRGDVYVERNDPEHPETNGERVKVQIPPILTMHPSDDQGSISVLGLSPLVRFAAVDPRGRAHLAGIGVGDTILSWDDIAHPSRSAIRRAIHECAEWDIPFKVRTHDGRIVFGFVRPKNNRRGPATVQAICESIEQNATPGDVVKARFSKVRKLGIADRAGIEAGDVILVCAGKENPSAIAVNSAIRTQEGKAVRFSLRKKDGRAVEVELVPQSSGSISASYNLVADDVLRVGSVVPTINGKPSPAAEAGIEKGATITAVNGQPVSKWRDLIDAFRAGAGSTVEVSYLDAGNQPGEAFMRVPHCLRTLLGVGPEARIVSIGGHKRINIETRKGKEIAAVGYRKSISTILTRLLGETQVPVEYRESPLDEVQIKYIDPTEEMVDPWLGRIGYAANIEVAPEMKLLKGDGLFDAVRIGFHKTYYFIMTVYQTMQRMIFTRSVGVENISGPLGIIDLGGKVARTGFVEFVFFMAIISANLAVINFLPLPIVDGGLMIFLVIEKIKGSPVSLRVQIATQMIGIFLIVGIFLFVTFNDVIRMWG